MHPWPRRAAFLSLVAALCLLARLGWRAPEPEPSLEGFRDAISDLPAHRAGGHAAVLGEGPASCVHCHISHAAKARKPAWQSQGVLGAGAFARDAKRAGGEKTGMCMSCHDGTIASAIKGHALAQTGAGSVAQGNMGAAHPVGVDYMAAYARDPGSFNHPSSSVQIVLEDGKVGCVSCHSAHDGVMSARNLRQEICIACHAR